MTAQKIFYGGIPTDVDVRRLEDAFPSGAMEAGDVFKYYDVAGLIGSDKGSLRFRTVTNRWRGKVERETGKRIGAYDGEFFRVMTEREKLEAIEAKRKSIAGLIRKNIRRVPLVERSKLDEHECARLDHCYMNDRNMLASQQLYSKEKLLPEV